MQIYTDQDIIHSYSVIASGGPYDCKEKRGEGNQQVDVEPVLSKRMQKGCERVFLKNKLL